MSGSRCTTKALVLGAALAACLATSILPALAASPGRPADRPSGSAGYLELAGVSSVSPTDAWAVGRHVRFGGADWSPVILHWDGSSWTRIDGPDPGSRAQLSAVSAIAPDDAWAVGSYTEAGIVLTLIEHWDGTRWSLVPSPSPGLTQNFLTGVSAVSPGRAWAVGGYGFSDGQRREVRTLIVRWEGHTWTQVPSPNPGVRSNVLTGVAATSAADAWAVGSYTPTFRSGHRATLALHWDGASWSQVETPNPGGRQDIFTAVSATSSRHAWAVGAYRGDGKGRQTLIARWTGSDWTQVWSPNPGPTQNHLFGVSIVSPDDVWAVGDYVTTNGVGPSRVLIAHFSRGGWTQVQSHHPSGYLVSVSGDSATDAWAIGPRLLLHWDGARWNRVAQPGHQRA